MALPKIQEPLNYISQLPDEPNDVGGFSAAQLKEEFDRAGQEIKEYINEELIPQIESDINAAAAGVGSTGSIDGSKIGDKSVPGTKFEDGTITAEKYGASSIPTTAYQDDSVTRDKLAPDSVGENEIADGAVKRWHLADEIIDSTKLFNSSVTTPKVADGAITEPKVADGAITEPKVADGAITTPKIADGAITPEKLSPTIIRVNPNLLDNWYFANPVNQRYVSGTISTAGYFLDRWKLTSGSVTIESDGITLNGTIVQILEFAVGHTVTATVLTASGIADITPSYSDTDKTFTITASGKKIIAAKLELGSQQTLARQDNGAWVLNEMPNYGEQLRRCERFYQKYTNIGVTTRANGCASFSFTTTMRTSPAMTYRERKVFTNTAADVSGSFNFNPGLDANNFVLWNGFYDGFVDCVYVDVKLTADL